jgi:hypothetical protein
MSWSPALALAVESLVQRADQEHAGLEQSTRHEAGSRQTVPSRIEGGDRLGQSGRRAQC